MRINVAEKNSSGTRNIASQKPMQALRDRPKAQVIVARSDTECARAASLFPKCVVLCPNSEWPDLTGRNVVAFGLPTAAVALTMAQVVKVIEGEIPAELTIQTALAWAKAQATPYAAPQVPEPSPSMTSEVSHDKPAVAAPESAPVVSGLGSLPDATPPHSSPEGKPQVADLDTARVTSTARRQMKLLKMR